MKKFVMALLAAVLVLGLCTVAYAAHDCEASSADYYWTYKYEGEYVDWEAIPCDGEYRDVQLCPCGESLSVSSIRVKDHTWSLKVHAPTCEDQGEQYHYCTVCKAQTPIEIIDELEHYPKNGVVDYKAPTCDENGYSKYECGRCGEIQSETHLKHTHVFHDDNFYNAREADRKEATCTEDGYAIFYCQCGECECTESKLVVYPKLNHKDGTVSAWYEEHTIVEPTCTEAGEGIDRCYLCGAEKPAVRKAPGHAWTEYTVIIEPLCEADGYKTRICTREGCKDGRNGKAAEEVVVLPKLNHDEISKVTKNASCTEEGSKTVTCKRCAKVWVESIAKVDCTWTEWTVIGECKVRTCKVCYAIQKEGAAVTPDTPVVPEDKPAEDEDNNSSEGTGSSTGSGSDASIPATGDNTSNVPYIMMVAAVAGLVVLVASKRKVNC